ncbi:LacI family DNA-binding transcriptional regulator [Virgibacillus oceani]|uniref:LacI family transcriptional regulator n=1 Tax=Virgibacillus oceani TaxID=1479511 RepID=A0A917HAE7_9BACI|nr:LacI family DNA-binding transcriptional regulator [Virgibacillus oceani]GGG72780.1 LacI family transcriptional regulator [Virgibacillus oceani]
MANVTIKDIAEKSGVSTATVSRVLNRSGYASAEIKDKVFSVAKELNYRPNGIARSLKMHKTNTIGIIIPDISNPYFMKISKGIEDVIQNEDYVLIFVSGDESPIKEEKTLKVLLENRVEGIVLATSSEDDENITKIQQAGVPVVLIDRKLENQLVDLDFVVEDNVEAAYQLTKYLIEQGHRHIGVINGSLKVSTGMERYMGYKKAIMEYGMEENADLVFNGNFIQEDGEEAVAKFFERDTKPTAILSFNNTMTYGAVLQLSRMGLTVPDDIVVASYGETEIAQLLKPPGIISVKQSPYEMGVRVGEILLERLANKEKEATHEIFTPKLDIYENNVKEVK